MKARLVTFLLFAPVVVALAAASGLWLLRAPDPGGQAQVFTVRPGASLTEIAGELEGRRLIRNPVAFAALGRLRGWAHLVQAGRYGLSPAESGDRILRRLVAGDTIPVRVTFPEGIWMTEIASLVADSLAVDSAAVVRAARDPALLASLGIDAPSAEGYLFPSTYEFGPHESATSVVERLVREGVAQWTPERHRRAHGLGLGRHEVLTLASIVEAETGRVDERARVSAVYLRRLKENMRLQADPTILYGLGKRGHRLTRADLENASPYNTYLNVGLPPGPIGNPGLAAIDAALDPDPTCTALYFVAGPDGAHRFTNTLEEHTAVCRSLQAARDGEGR